jgi:hypothetical protein
LIIIPAALSALLLHGSARAGLSSHTTAQLTTATLYLPYASKPLRLPPNTVFEFEPTIVPGQRELIRDAFGMGYEYFAERGVVDSGGATVFVYATLETLVEHYAQWYGVSQDEARRVWGTCNTAVAGRKGVFVYASCWWATAPDYARAKVMVHEYFHLLQDELVGPSTWMTMRADPVPTRGPVWLLEGSAEYFGWQVVGSQGMYDFETARQTQLTEAKACSAPLQSMETSSGWATACQFPYPLGFVAADYLVSLHGESALVEFYASIGQGAAWETAFQTAFDVSASGFYQQFQDYRDGL